MTQSIGNFPKFKSLFLTGISSNTWWASEPLAATADLQASTVPFPASPCACESKPHRITPPLDHPALSPQTFWTRHGETTTTTLSSRAPVDATAPRLVRRHPATPSRHRRHHSTCTRRPCSLDHPCHWSEPETASRPCRNHDLATLRPSLSGL
jgi:hypothetical protein